MTPEQIKLLKESYMVEATRPDKRKSTLGEYMRFCLDGGMDFVTSKDFVVFDDENTMLHCIALNDDMKSQGTFPVKVISADYSIVFEVETIFSAENFDKFLETGYINSLLSDEKKKMLKDWVKHRHMQDLQNEKATPYYSREPKVVPMASNKVERHDGLQYPVPEASLIDPAVTKNTSMVDGVVYATFAEAVAAAATNGGVVTLTADTMAPALKVTEGSNFTIDLNGHEFIVQDPTVGSAGTETLGFQILKGSNVTFKNGIIKMNTDKMKMLIQNYADSLTLENVILDGTMDNGAACKYVLSNNNGVVTLKGNTQIIAGNGQVAFDAYYWPKAGYGDILVKTEDFTGSVTGKIEWAHDDSVTDEIAAEHSVIALDAGTYTVPIESSWLAADYECVLNNDNTYTIQPMPIKAVVNGVEYTTVNAAVAAAIEYGSGIVTLTEDANAEGIKVDTGSSLTIDLNDHELIIQDPTTGSAGTATNGFQFLKDSNVVLKNGTIKMNTESMKILIQNYANLTLDNMILDGTMEGTEGCKFVLSHNNDIVTLKGNTQIIAADGQVAFDAYYWPKAGYGDVSIITDEFTGFIDGKIYTAHDDSVTDEVSDEHAKIIITSGTFTIEPDAKYIARGFKVTQDVTTGNYEIQEMEPTATVNGVEYVYMYDAINGAAEVGGIVTMVADAEVDEKLIIEKDAEVTIDLAGHNLTMADGVDNYGTVLRGSMTINDESQLANVVVPGSFGFGLATSCTGTLTINGGNFSTEGSYLIGAFAGKVVINGGTFTGPYCILNSFDGYTATAEITGGKFTVTGSDNDTAAPLLGVNIKVSGGVFSHPVLEEYCAEGYRPCQNDDGTYGVEEIPTCATVDGVEYKTLSAAFENASAGSTLTLADNYEETSTDTVAYSLKNNISITGDAKISTSTNRKVFEITGDAAEVSIDGTSIVNNYDGGRAIDIRKGDVSVNLSNASMIVGTKEVPSANAQAITIGGSGSNINLNIDNSTIDAGVAGYGLIAFNPVVATIKDSMLNGYNSIYLKAPSSSLGSAGSEIILDNCKIDSKNNRTDMSNTFATIVFEQGDSEVILKNGTTVNIEADKPAIQALVSFSTSNVTNAKVVIESGCKINLSGNSARYIVNLGSNSVVVHDKDLAEAIIALEDYNLTENADGTYTITA